MVAEVGLGLEVAVSRERLAQRLLSPGWWWAAAEDLTNSCVAPFPWEELGWARLKAPRQWEQVGGVVQVPIAH